MLIKRFQMLAVKMQRLKLQLHKVLQMKIPSFHTKLSLPLLEIITKVKLPVFNSRNHGYYCLLVIAVKKKQVE